MFSSQSSCFISDSRICHVPSPNDVVFIVGSGSSQFEEDITVIKNVLSTFGLKGYFALLSDEQKGLDAFCDKICSKIQESLFCIVMLNNPIISMVDKNTKTKIGSLPSISANVYFEFGMAVALQKPCIPIIRKGSNLPFDVQHLDTVIYDDMIDLKEKLRSPIHSVLTKKKKEYWTTNPDFVKLVYGPLYSEISRYLSKKDRFTKFNPSKHDEVITHYKYLFDTIDIDLQTKIEEFYGELQEFNKCVDRSERIIPEIVADEIARFRGIPIDRSLSISIELTTDSGQILPTLSQVLLRNTTPEKFLELVEYSGEIRTITYKLTRSGSPQGEKLSPETYRKILDKCKTQVEKDKTVLTMRSLKKSLQKKGKALKETIFQFCK